MRSNYFEFLHLLVLCQKLSGIWEIDWKVSHAQNHNSLKVGRRFSKRIIGKMTDFCTFQYKSWFDSPAIKLSHFSSSFNWHVCVEFDAWLGCFFQAFSDMFFCRSANSLQPRSDCCPAAQTKPRQSRNFSPVQWNLSRAWGRTFQSSPFIMMCEFVWI